MDEINKLYNWLTEHKDFYGWRIEKVDRDPYGSSPWHQVIIYDKGDEGLWDAVWHSFSYGFKQGLLEIMGDEIMNEEEDGDGVVGWLTADDVIERVIKAYDEPKMKEE